jgi:hypothetical protein
MFIYVLTHYSEVYIFANLCHFMTVERAALPREPWLVGAVRSFFEPGVGHGLLNFTRYVIFAMLCFFVIWPFIDYSIHYVVMAILSFCLFLSYEYFIYHLKKDPEVMRGNRPKTE